LRECALNTTDAEDTSLADSADLESSASTPRAHSTYTRTFQKFGLSSEEFCEKLLAEGGVAIVPGTAFGECGEGFARISYAYSVEHISKAIDRIEKFINKLG